MHLGRYFGYLAIGGGSIATAAALAMAVLPPASAPNKAPITTADANKPSTNFQQAAAQAPITVVQIDNLLELLRTSAGHNHPAINVAIDPTKNFIFKHGEEYPILDKITFINQTVNVGGERTMTYDKDVKNRISAFQTAMGLSVTGHVDPETFKAYMQADRFIKARIGLIAKKSELQNRGSARKALLAVGKESSFNPNAKAEKSSGTGLMQMTHLAWEEVFMRHGHEFGQKDLVEALKKNPSDENLRDQMFIKRLDPEFAIPLGMLYFKKDYVEFVMGDTGAKNLKDMASSPGPKTADFGEYTAAHKKNKHSPLVYDNPSERLGKKSKNPKDPVRSFAKANPKLFFKDYNEKTKKWENPRTSAELLAYMEKEFMKRESEVKAIETLVDNLLKSPAPVRTILPGGQVITASLAGKKP